MLIAGTATDAGEVTVLANAYPLSVVSGGAFTGKIPLDVGLNTIVVGATDGAGNQTAVTLFGTRDVQPPQVTVATPAGGETVTTDRVAVSGTAIDETAITLTVNGAAVPLASGGAFSSDVTLIDQTPAYDLTEPEPVPDFDFDQSHGA